MFAAIVNSEAGWHALLVNREGEPSVVQIHRWGLSVGQGEPMAPLDDQNRDLTKRENFVMLMNPDQTRQLGAHVQAQLCKRKAREIGWLRD